MSYCHLVAGVGTNFANGFGPQPRALIQDRMNFGFCLTACGGGGAPNVRSDFDGDRLSDVGVYRPSTGTWYLQRSTQGFTAIPFGANGDKPASGDYDGDGKYDIGVFRPTTGSWYIQRSTAGFYALTFGTNGDVPTAGAYVP
jgi:hypothetical protein